MHQHEVGLVTNRAVKRTVYLPNASFVVQPMRGFAGDVVTFLHRQRLPRRPNDAVAVMQDEMTIKRLRSFERIGHGEQPQLHYPR